MKKSDIVGHRGVAGLELENTIPGFEKAIAIGVQTIECDLRETRDGQFVLCHDAHLRRVSASSMRIQGSSYAELQNIPLHNGSRVPLLREVLELARRHQVAVIVELKTCQDAQGLGRLLAEYHDVDITVASLRASLIERIQKQYPPKTVSFSLCVPFYIVHRARSLGAQKIVINFWLMNPLLYRFAERQGLQIFVYTIDSPWLVRLFRQLYPGILICTNHPERLVN